VSAGRFELAPGYSVSRVLNGCWQLSAGHQSRPLEEGAVLDGWMRLAEAGFTTFDCADIYTGVEELLGRFLSRWRQAGHDPQSIQIHTKYVPDLDQLPSLSRDRVEAIVDRSLRRLGVECLDLVQLAWWDYSIPGWVEAAGWLDELRRAGKIRCLGATNFDTPRLEEILEAGIDLVAHQVQYSVLDRRPENGMSQLCSRHGTSLLCYGSLAGGFLSSRWLGTAPPEEPLDNRSLVKYRLIVEEFGGWSLFQELLGELAAIAGQRGTTLSSVAARWVLDRPAVAGVIAGARDAAHLDENLALLELCLNDRDLERLAVVIARSAGPGGDTFGLERLPDGPHSSIMWKNLNRADE
jgi:aryl-alcohol dehydrogenase-like predicted oxidoreductase